MYGFMNIQKHLTKFFFQPLTAPETLDNFAADKISKLLELWNN
mgnify:FL=1